MNRKKLYEELKLTRFLLDLVNSKEEYEYLLREEAEILYLLTSNTQYLKGGKLSGLRITC
jgi:hypothetical protein